MTEILFVPITDSINSEVRLRDEVQIKDVSV